jgi:hypothetical protein
MDSPPVIEPWSEFFLNSRTRTSASPGIACGVGWSVRTVIPVSVSKIARMVFPPTLKNADSATIFVRHKLRDSWPVVFAVQAHLNPTAART